MKVTKLMWPITLVVLGASLHNNNIVFLVRTLCSIRQEINPNFYCVYARYKYTVAMIKSSEIFMDVANYIIHPKTLLN